MIRIEYNCNVRLSMVNRFFISAHQLARGSHYVEQYVNFSKVLFIRLYNHHMIFLLALASHDTSNNFSISFTIPIKVFLTLEF